MELTANTPFLRPAVPPAAVAGAAAWLATPLPAGSRLPAWSIEHLLLLFPLVAAPLALAVVAALRHEAGAATSGSLELARRLQPIAAALLVLSFVSPTGRGAGALALPWLGVAVASAGSGVSDAVRRRSALPAALVAAPLFLAVGAVWLVLARLGAGPRSYSPAMVSLAAAHFHFVGFATQVLAAATQRRLAASPRLRALCRAASAAALAGLPLLAAGKALALPLARIAGVGAVAVALLALSVTTTSVALAARRASTRALLVASAVSGAAAVGLAAGYGAGELAGREWIGLGTMTAAHGALMALGFTVCGLVAHLRLLRAP